MSLLDAISKKRALLKHTTTRVTTTSGQVVLEEMKNDRLQVLASAIEQREDCPGFIVDYKPDLQVAQILPSLFLGSQDITQEPDILREYGITDIVSVGVGVPHLQSMPHLKHHFCSALDVPETDLNTILNCTLPIIRRIIISGGRVFVHCNAGVSRAPTVVIAYLMEDHGLSFLEAFKLVCEKRPVAKPNSGFIKQLCEIEESRNLKEVVNSDGYKK